MPPINVTGGIIFDNFLPVGLTFGLLGVVLFLPITVVSLVPTRIRVDATILFIIGL